MLAVAEEFSRTVWSGVMNSHQRVVVVDLHTLITLGSDSVEGTTPNGAAAACRNMLPVRTRAERSKCNPYQGLGIEEGGYLVRGQAHNLQVVR